MVQCSLRLAVGEARTTWRHSSVGQSIRFIPEVSPVRIQVPLPGGMLHPQHPILGPLVKWLRHRPFTAVTWVRVPYGSPYGGIAQLVERSPHTREVTDSSSVVSTKKRLEILKFQDVSFLCPFPFGALCCYLSVPSKARPFSSEKGRAYLVHWGSEGSAGAALHG